MMKLLLQTEGKLLLNHVKSSKKQAYATIGFSTLFIALIVYFLSKGVWNVAPSLSFETVSSLFSYSCLLLMGMLVLMGIPQVFKNLYSSLDLSFLFTMPIPTKQLFWVKYIKSFLSTPLIMFFLFYIPLIVYGIRVHAHFLFYIISLAVLLSTAVIGLSICYLLNLLLVQLIPAQRANELMTAMSALSGVIVYVLFQLPNFSSNGAPFEKAITALPLFPNWTPFYWASTAITSSAKGSVHAFLPALSIMGLAFLSMLLSSFLVEKGFRTGWVRLSEGKVKKRAKISSSKKYRVHHPVMVIGLTDWKNIKRDLREWLVFMPFVFFLIFPTIGFLKSGATLENIISYKDNVWLGVQVFFLFFHALFNGSMSASSIAREAETAPLIKSLPISSWQLALGKLWISWLLPFILLSTIEIVLGLFIHWSAVQIISGILLKGILTIGISSIGIWLGTIGAKHNPNNPQNRLTFGVSILLAILAYVYLFIALIPFALLNLPSSFKVFADELAGSGFIGFIAGLVSDLLSFKMAHPAITYLIGIALIIIFSVGIAFLMLKLSTIRLKKGIRVAKVQSRSNLGRQS
ncbi:hypothetical protein CIB87_01975 [Priestia megaterium]|uniref:ABC-2 type transport system permease protein n=1 Tax=Priestia megaterium TaxID=1404 RepID=A0AA86LTP1_PRIMG|nr:hypothetical protein [Priestia megaterium]AXI27837.1 hypothetical protein CIB87_01975 [Priestia megaterium]